MNLLHFPYDVQTCNISFINWVYAGAGTAFHPTQTEVIKRYWLSFQNPQKKAPTCHATLYISSVTFQRNKRISNTKHLTAEFLLKFPGWHKPVLGKWWVGSGRIEDILIFQGNSWGDRDISSCGIFYSIEKETNIFCSKCNCAKVNVSSMIFQE